MNGGPHALSVSGALDEIAGVRRWLAEVLLQWEVTHTAATDIQTAVTEVCTNVIRHGYPDNYAGEIRLEASIDAGTVTVTVTDDAPGYNPGPDVALPTEPLAEGGYGRYLAHSLMDEVRYESLGGSGNRTTLVKRLTTT